MAELLVRVVDRGDPNDDASSKRGDVIALCPDGWAWSAAELSEPFWRVIAVPGVPVDDLRDLMESPRAESARPRLRRVRYLDLDRATPGQSFRGDRTFPVIQATLGVLRSWVQDR